MNGIADEIGKMTEMLTADDTGEPDEDLDLDTKDSDTDSDDSSKDDDTKSDDKASDDDSDSDSDTDSKSDDDSDKDDDSDSDKDQDQDQDDDPDEVTTLKARIVELETAKPKDEPEPKPEPDPEPEPEPIKEVDFLGDLDLDDLNRDPVAFNKLLNTIYTKGIEIARLESLSSQEGILRSIPEIVKSNITVVSSIKKAGEAFYKENEDLKPWKKAVASVFEEVAAENPDKTYAEVLKDVGPKVRERLDLQKKANEPKDDKDPDDDTKPKLPRNKGNKRQTTKKPKTSSLESELDEMNKSLEEE
jgi:hypothetical protein